MHDTDGLSESLGRLRATMATNSGEHWLPKGYKDDITQNMYKLPGSIHSTCRRGRERATCKTLERMVPIGVDNTGLGGPKIRVFKEPSHVHNLETVQTQQGKPS